MKLMRQTITRVGEFDAAHRVMNERIKCYNLHGHRFKYELTFSFQEENGLGYAIDFKEIKRVACAFIDDYLDHGMIANPKDEVCIKACKDLGTKLWLMTLNGTEYCNPSAEHISKEMFMALNALMSDDNLRLENIRLYETPNCWVDCDCKCISSHDEFMFFETKQEFKSGATCWKDEINNYKKEKGVMDYDDRNCY